MNYLSAFNKNGFGLRNGLISTGDIAAICDETAPALQANKGGGIRNADVKFESVGRLARNNKVVNCAGEFLPGEPQLVRAILFDKTPAKNWLVSWHQDRTVAVSDKFDKPGLGPWIIKDGVHHVQPPVAVLEQMVTLRIHLDDASLENGCLKVIAGSHRKGVLLQAEIDTLATDGEPVFIEAAQGTSLIMRPHLLHASSKATSPSRRRILHLEYSSYVLPSGVSCC